LRNPLDAIHAATAPVSGTPAARSALILGACGATGEALLNDLLASPAYSGVVAVTRLPLPSTTPKLTTHMQADAAPPLALPHTDDAYLVIGEHNSYYRRDEAFRELKLDDLQAAAQAARAAGITRLAVVAPVAIYTHSSAFRASLMNQTEYHLHALGFEALVLVRPAAPEKFERQRQFGKRVAAFLLGQVHGLMPENYHPPTSRLVARAAAGALVNPRAGLTVIDADAVRESARPGLPGSA
jgi:uncharacterized protein YbjT (DUF2867 family)